MDSIYVGRWKHYLPLRREVTETRGDSEEEGIELGELCDV